MACLPAWGSAQSLCGTYLRLSEVTCSTAVVHCTFTDSSVSDYALTYRPDEDPNAWRPLQPNVQHTATLRLEGGTVYLIHLTYACDGQTVTKALSFRTPDCAAGENSPCTAPRLNLQSVQYNAATLTWGTVNIPGPYEVRLIEAGTHLRVYSTFSPYLPVRLESNTSYEAELAYLCNGRRISSRLNFRSPACPPDSTCLPVAARVREVDCTSVDLFWTNPPGAARAYQVVYRKDGTGPAETRQIPNGASTYRLNNLALNAVYTFDLSYLCPSNSQRIVTNLATSLPPCSTANCLPLNLAIQEVSCSTATLFWQVPNVSTACTLTVRPASGTTQEYFVRSTRFTLSGLQASMGYVVTISYSCNGEMVSEERRFQTPSCGGSGSCFEGVDVYPNPNNGVFYVQFPVEMSGVVNLTLTDLTGKVVHSQSQDITATHEMRVDVSGSLPKGMYILTLVQGSCKINTRVLIH